MEKRYVSLLLVMALKLNLFAQTTLTVDANEVLNSNNKLVIQTPYGQSFFTGHQVGSGYGYPDGIFRAITDNPTQRNYFFEGLRYDTPSSSYLTTFSVGSDGTGYFASHVGIGTSNPFQPLDMPITSNGKGISLGTYNSLSAGQFAFVGITGADGTFNSGNLTGSDNGAAGIAIIHTSGGIGNSAELAFVTHNNGFDSRERLRIDRSGNVGIGTSSPSSLLTINTSLEPGASPSLLLNNTNPGYGNSISFATTGTVKGVIRADQAGNLGLDSKGSGNIDFNYFGSTGDINFWQGVGTGGYASARNVIIKNNGNVGIGTTDNANWQLANSTYKLAVGGNVIAEGVTVKLHANWPDYVFKPNYILRPLSEIKTYIDENHHLPDMPSAAEVEKEGLNLGEMNKLLTKKVEELTLYLIEKDKELNRQQEQLNEMNKKIDNLIYKNINNK